MTATASPAPASQPSASAGQQSAPTAPSSTTTPVGPAPGPGAKARPGELRARIAQVMAASPGRAFTVTELARRLGHSGGAVGNACETLVCRGEAEQSGAKPRTYRATSATAAAAQHAVPPPAASSGTTQAPHQTPQQAPSAPPPGGRPGPIVRPNGQKYHPRALAQLPDVEALRRLREAKVAVLLYGPPGTGKTSLIEAAFPDLITVAGDGDTTVGDLIGEYTQDSNGGYEFVYGPLVTAMQEGRALLLDDATLISPKVLAALYPAMDLPASRRTRARRSRPPTAST